MFKNLKFHIVFLDLEEAGGPSGPIGPIAAMGPFGPIDFYELGYKKVGLSNLVAKLKAPARDPKQCCFLDFCMIVFVFYMMFT